MKIDQEKLAKMIEQLVGDVGGMCCASSMCIGEIDGKQIQLNVTSQDDDFMKFKPINQCVKK